MGDVKFSNQDREHREQGKFEVLVGDTEEVSIRGSSVDMGLKSGLQMANGQCAEGQGRVSEGSSISGTRKRNAWRRFEKEQGERR